MEKDEPSSYQISWTWQLRYATEHEILMLYTLDLLPKHSEAIFFFWELIRFNLIQLVPMYSFKLISVAHLQPFPSWCTANVYRFIRLTLSRPKWQFFKSVDLAHCYLAVWLVWDTFIPKAIGLKYLHLVIKPYCKCTQLLHLFHIEAVTHDSPSVNK